MELDPNTLHVAVRVYANGETKITKRKAEGIENWLTYNRRMRPGNALFVNGKLASDTDKGYLSEREIAYVEDYLATHDTSAILEDTIGPQAESSGPMNAMTFTYTGYQPERSWSRFDFRDIRS